MTDEDFQEGSIDLITMLVKTGLVPSRSEGRRAIEQVEYPLTVKDHRYQTHSKKRGFQRRRHGAETR